MSQRLSVIFVIICLVSALVLGVRIWSIRPLYLDANVRGAVEQTLRTVADQKGWLISDMEVAGVTSERVTITYRRHSRRRDPAFCYQLSLHDSSLTPCES